MLDFVILIPCFNNQLGLEKSIESVFYKNHNYEILIIDDGSIIPLSEIKLQEKFPNKPLSVIRLNDNSGITKALNTGLDYILKFKETKYIARLDCSDTCQADRFNKQVEFLEKHHDIYLLGTWCEFQDEKSKKKYIYKTKTKHQDIIKEMHFKCSFIHPTVMFKKEVLKSIGFYPYEFSHAEDYAFFWKILKKHTGEIIPEILVRISTNSESISSKHYKRQLKSRLKVVANFGTEKVNISLGKTMVLIRYLLPEKIIKFLKS